MMPCVESGAEQCHVYRVGLNDVMSVEWGYMMS